MPITAAVNDVYEVVIEGAIEGQLTANVLHFACVGADSDVELHLIQVLLECFITNLLPVLSNDWALTRVRWKKVSPVLGIEQISVPSGGIAVGGSSVDSLPSFVSSVFSKRTLFAGRSGRGRMYICGIPETAAVGSILSTASDYWAGALAFAVCVITNFSHPDPAGGTNIWDLCVFSRKLAGTTVAPFPGAAFKHVRELVPVAELGTTRSRKIGRGA